MSRIIFAIACHFPVFGCFRPVFFSGLGFLQELFQPLQIVQLVKAAEAVLRGQLAGVEDPGGGQQLPVGAEGVLGGRVRALNERPAVRQLLRFFIRYGLLSEKGCDETRERSLEGVCDELLALSCADFFPADQ